MQKKILILERALPIDEQNSVCIASQTSAATTRNYYCKALQRKIKERASQFPFQYTKIRNCTSCELDTKLR